MKRLILICLCLFSWAGVAMAQPPIAATPTPITSDCSGYQHLAEKAYSTDRWWKLASFTSVTKSEDKRLDTFVANGCPIQIRHHAKHQYKMFYYKVIAPGVCGGVRSADCAVFGCESGYGAGNYRFGLTIYWNSEAPLPKWKGHSSTGTRFASGEPSATLIEDNVFMAAALKFGPIPGTCAS